MHECHVLYLMSTVNLRAAGPTQMKLGSWAALFCCLASLAHMKTGDLQSKHLMMSLMFAVFCLFK